MTTTIYLIFYIDVAVWLIAPFRQYKTKYFAFFMILAIIDPTYPLILLFKHVNPVRIYFIADYLMIISVLFRKWQFKTIIISSLALLMVIIADIYLPLENIYLIKMTFSCILGFIFIKDTMLTFHNTYKLNLFCVILVLYEITIVIKYLDFLSFLKTGITDFYVSTAFEILIGIFFCIYNVNNSPTFKLFFKNPIDTS